MQNEGKRLHGLGYAVLWLKPNSKQPLEKGWTKGARKTWGELSDSYRYGFNLGVRLGAASNFGDGYLAVIDCDVKSSDEKHLKEMETKLKELSIPDSAPVVFSGRGNGSRHIHVKTKTPQKTFRFSQSKDKVKVKMPSMPPSGADQKGLTASEITEGFRLRAAWEISVMGEGGQVVLPPSLHPDTGQTYEWARKINSSTDLPEIDFSKIAGAKTLRTDSSFSPMIAFTPAVFDIVGSSLTNEMVDLILSGKHSSGDRSADSFKATIALLNAGATDNEILTILTDRDTYLGQTPYDHTHSESRLRAADWVAKFCLKKAKQETQAAEQFKAEVELITLDPEAALAQSKELTTPSDWTQLLERTSPETGARVKPNLKNLNTILKHYGGGGFFRHNIFAQRFEYAKNAPWNRKTTGAAITDIDIVNIQHWLVDRYRVDMAEPRIWPAVFQLASENPYHPVREYLDGLVWDRKPRIDSWLIDYLGAVGDPVYLKDVGVKTLVAMVARAFEPGIKYDQVLILEGPQGVGKSTSLRALGGQWFSDAAINLNDKDAVLSICSVWLMELGELSGMRKADVDHLKEFISRSEDRIRPPYGRAMVEYPRQSIFVGTTNTDRYLKDVTGNRRFWPVKVTKCLPQKIKEDRDQLFAEAVIAWNLGEPLWLENREVRKYAEEAQTERRILDPLAEKLEEFFSQPNPNFNVEEFTTNDLFSDFGPVPMARPDHATAARLYAILRDMGYQNTQLRRNNKRPRLWIRGKS